jgi:hypothetical protein
VTERTSAARAMLDQMGGVSGLIYSSLPVIAFVPMSSWFGLVPAIIAALGVAALVLVWRLWRRESIQPAISGFMGVGVCAAIAYFMGQSKGYFALGIWSYLFWAVVFAASVVVRRPIVGYIWGFIKEHDTNWRQVRKAVWAYDIATLIWVAVFSSRFVVQGYLYHTDQVGWLGFARIAMGWPLFGLAVLMTYFPIRVAQRAVEHAKRQHEAEAEPAPSADEALEG